MGTKSDQDPGKLNQSCTKWARTSSPRPHHIRLPSTSLTEECVKSHASRYPKTHQPTCGCEDEEQGLGRAAELSQPQTSEMQHNPLWSQSLFIGTGTYTVNSLKAYQANFLGVVESYTRGCLLALHADMRRLWAVQVCVKESH